MKKKTKRNLIIAIAAIVIVLIAAGAAWFIYPFIRYSSHTLAYRSALPGNACYQYPIQYSKEGWFLIDCTLNGTHKVPLRIDTQATKIPSKPTVANTGGICRLKAPMRIKRKILRNCTHSLLLLLVRQASKNRCSTAFAKIT